MFKEVLTTLNLLGIDVDENIIILADRNIQQIDACLKVLSSHHIALNFFDAHYPSPSDPGAYFSYMYDSLASEWRMTLANHGWSGGIYLIRSETLLIQLTGIINKDTTIRCTIKSKDSFEQKSIVSVERNRSMNSAIQLLHLPMY